MEVSRRPPILYGQLMALRVEKSIPTKDGLALPMIGFGTWSLRGQECVQAVRCALDCGYRLIDTASFYGNEKDVGLAVRQSGIDRQKTIVQTKLYPNQYAQAEKSIDEALRKLDIDFIDVMMLHHPAVNDVAAYHAIERAIDEGKVRAAGISCYYISESSRFLPRVSKKPILIQNEIHPFYQDTAVIEHIQALGISVQSWYPFGGRGYAGELFKNPTLLEIANHHNKSAAQVVLRWHIQRAVAVIPGSSNPKHIEENREIFDFELNDEEMMLIAGLDRSEKHDWY